MKVFLSWSGAESKVIALAFREYLPKMLQAVEPFMSDVDIAKGARPLNVIADELKSTKVGIVFVTAANALTPWINYEAGAISKTVKDDSLVCVYAYDIDFPQIKGPLGQFQGTRFNKADTKKLIATVNAGLGKYARRDADLNEIFDVWWPKLEERINVELKRVAEQQKPPDRSERDMIQEILEVVRELNRWEAARPKGLVARSQVEGRAGRLKYAWPHESHRALWLPADEYAAAVEFVKELEASRWLTGQETPESKEDETKP